MTLLIMAAGIGSRFGGGIKQLAPIDEAGHIIMDYSIHDAIAAGCLKEEDIYGEIGELVLGTKVGRENDEEITIFDTTGMGIQDNTTAEAIYKVALEKGMGSWFEFI